MNAMGRLIVIEGLFFARQRQAVFWTFFLPVFMLLFFGEVFKGVGYIEFLVPGLIGMNLMSTSFFAVGTLLVGYRERGILKRLRATPLKPSTYIAAHVLNRYLIAGIQALILIGLGRALFGATPRGSALAIGLVLTIGLLSFMALGLFIASVASTQSTAAGISNVFFLPSLFLGGAYFPPDTFPPMLRLIGKSLPLAPFLVALRGVYSRGMPLDAVVAPLAIVAVWGAVAAILSVLCFRWE